MNQYTDKELETPEEVMDVWMENYALNHLIHTKMYMIGLKTNKKGVMKNNVKRNILITFIGLLYVSYMIYSRM